MQNLDFHQSRESARLADADGATPKRNGGKMRAKLSQTSGSKTAKLAKLNPKNWTKRGRIIGAVIAGLIVIGAIFAVWWFLLRPDNSDQKLNNLGQTNQTKPTKYYSPLTGLETTQAKTTAPVLAVMIENSPDARPQSGLHDAGVVFEAVAEGGITRFIALYQESEPSLIGPVRSVRPYYLDFALPFQPAVAHVGGSYEALNMIRSGNYGVDLDQFYNDGAYWRATDRYAPHNVYTDYQHMADLMKAKGKTESKFSGWPRTKITDSATKSDQEKTESAASTDSDTAKTTVETDSNPATAINLGVSTGQFAVSYQYDAAAKTYLRFQGGEPHLDREKGQIAPRVVIAMRVKQTYLSDGLHSDIDTTGQGEVYIFQDGTVTTGTWSRAAASDMLKFTDSAGQDIPLERGQTWVTAVGNNGEISWQ